MNLFFNTKKINNNKQFYLSIKFKPAWYLVSIIMAMFNVVIFIDDIPFLALLNIASIIIMSYFFIAKKKTDKPEFVFNWEKTVR